MIRIAINGFGRIGRNVVRAIFENKLHDEFQVVAINELAEPNAIMHLFKYDTTHGQFKLPVTLESGCLKIQDQLIQLRHEPKINAHPWRDLDIDVVFECSGTIKGYNDAASHIQCGAKKVLLSHPGDANMDATIVYGVNQDQLTAKHTIVSAASCTTNACIPVITVLDKALNIESGSVTTIHSAMNDQPVIDAYHPDLRRTRAASQSIIPVDTKLSVGIERILPKFAGRFEAISVRVPTVNVTALVLTITVKQQATIEQVNKLIKDAATGELHGILDYTEAPLVSSDFNHDPHSCILDGTQTRVSHGTLIKVLIWCDNEWGYANRMIDICRAMMNQTPNT